MNKVARAFLSPPTEAHLAVAQNDIRDVPLGEVTAYLFQTTVSVFELIHEMPEMPQ